MRCKIIFMCIVITMFSCKSKEEKESLANGKEIYIANCISCHLDTGKGVPGKYPSLIKPDRIVDAQTHRAIGLIKHGSGFDSGMKPISLTNKEITEVVNYIQNSWKNKASFLLQSQVDTIINQ